MCVVVALKTQFENGQLFRLYILWHSVSTHVSTCVATCFNWPTNSTGMHQSKLVVIIYGPDSPQPHLENDPCSVASAEIPISAGGGVIIEKGFLGKGHIQTSCSPKFLFASLPDEERPTTQRVWHSPASAS